MRLVKTMSLTIFSKDSVQCLNMNFTRSADDQAHVCSWQPSPRLNEVTLQNVFFPEKAWFLAKRNHVASPSMCVRYVTRAGITPLLVPSWPKMSWRRWQSVFGQKTCLHLQKQKPLVCLGVKSRPWIVSSLNSFLNHSLRFLFHSIERLSNCHFVSYPCQAAKVFEEGISTSGLFFQLLEGRRVCSWQS